MTNSASTSVRLRAGVGHSVMVIAEILQQEGFITGSRKVEDAEVGKNLVVEVKFGLKALAGAMPRPREDDAVQRLRNTARQPGVLAKEETAWLSCVG